MRLLILILMVLAGPVVAEIKPGDRFHVDPARLPPPYATPAAGNAPDVVPIPQQPRLQVPAGYEAGLFAQGLEHARNLIAAPDGAIILAQSRLGRITVLTDDNGDGRAESVRIFAQGFNQPHGLALVGTELWVADLDSVWRLPWPDGGKRIRITTPGALGSKGGHWTRNLAVADDRFYVAIGSDDNIAEEPAPRATIQEFRLNGGNQRTFASGLRNPVGITLHNGGLWAVVNERDGLGDDLVPDYLTRVQEGGFYGWPNSYVGDHPQPGFPLRPGIVPDLLFRSHSAPLGLAFWRGDAFVALHGSWNRAEPEGYFVARVPFKDGKPLGYYEAFATGFVVSPKPTAQVWERPVGVAAGPDDALYVSDDVGGTIWRIVRR